MRNVLSEAPEDWKEDKGYISEKHIREDLPPPGDDAMVLICGPVRRPSFCDFIQ